jgi:hypothetical protein
LLLAGIRSGNGTFRGENMNNAVGLLALPLSRPVLSSLILPALLLASCANSGGSAWTHASLAEAQQQQQMNTCNEQGIAAEKAYYSANSRGDANSASPFINNLKVRQRSIAARTDAYEACLLAAGFVRQP